MGMVYDGFVNIVTPDVPNGFYCNIRKLGQFLIENKLATEELEFDKYTKYVNVTGDVKILDSHTSPTLVKLKKWMCCNDPNTKWYEVVVSNSHDTLRSIFTDDHPLPVIRKNSEQDTPVRTQVKDIQIGDKIVTCSMFSSVGNSTMEVIEKNPFDASKHGGCDGYDVETESDYFDIYPLNVQKKQGETYSEWNISNTAICSHNCRTRVMGNVHDPEREVTCGRGNLSFTTINLPRLGIEADHNIDKFFELYDKMIDLVFEQLLHRFKIQSNRKVYNYPFLMGNGIWLDSEKLEWTDTIGEVLKHGTLTIGFCGLAECLVALIGKHHGESEEAQELGLRIVKHMRDRCDQKSQELKLNFTCIATPAESTAGRFAKLDRKKYGIIPGVTEREYYTNSNHVPVYYPIPAFKKIDIEAPYHQYCNAGSILYIEMQGDTAKNLEAFEKVVRYMHDKDAGYFSINHPVDRDPVCGYVGVIDDVCPRCGRREGEPISEEKLQELKRKYPNVPFHGCDCNH